MKLLDRCCAGLDVHRDTVSVCVRRSRGKAETVIEEAVFGTFTEKWERLCAWLKKQRVKQVALESTGVYWIPVWNVLEEHFRLLLVNPATGVRCKATRPIASCSPHCRITGAPRGAPRSAGH